MLRHALALGLALVSSFAGANTLQANFKNPPASAKPWVYWFWLNGNINREGITNDLEAMARVGIGGVLIMETDQGTPVGPVPFASPKWRELFRHVVSEANRLGILVNMNDDAGWCGSGGPWIRPDQSMQKVVWTETEVQGSFGGKLKQPETVAGFYRDIAVLAFPATGAYRIPRIKGKSGLERDDTPFSISFDQAPADEVIDPSKVVDLTKLMASDGSLNWKAPQGKWTVIRFGHTSTGAVNLPAPKSGEGLECDKLSKEGAEAAFNGFMKLLIEDNKPLVGRTLIRTHIDSWEMGSQNWTARFAAEFKKRRRYDIVRYLPIFTGRVIGSSEISERFLWDVRQTISELVLDNYAGHMRELAKRSGIELTIEAYGNVVVDDMAYAGRADEPMSEFWTYGGSGMKDPTANGQPYTAQMVSGSHVYGKRIIGVEAFTSGGAEKWLYHPASVKALGDYHFSKGLNRFVFHRYALQPWEIKPGVSMGPWGLHYERTQTWWEMSGPWHEYLSRCQYLLQQGQPVSEVLCLSPEGAPNNFVSPPTGRYLADGCPPEALLKMASVRNGRIVFPGGMSYRALLLPDGGFMTPEMLRKVKALADAGAVVVGPKPTKSASLTGFPACDTEVRKLAEEMWSSGKIVSGKRVEEVLSSKGVKPDFYSNRGFSATHRVIGDMDVYFVMNPKPHNVNAICDFEVRGKQAELWNPETGEVSPALMVNRSQISLSLGASDSVFVVFKPASALSDSVRSFERNGEPVFVSRDLVFPKVVVKKALWGPLGDDKRTKDVTAQVQAIVDRHPSEFRVADLASQGDPAYLVVKTLRMDYEVDGKPMTVSATDPEIISLPTAPADPLPVASVETRGGEMSVVTETAGDYVIRTGSGRILAASVASVPSPLELSGAWDVTFPGSIGVKRFDNLISWSDSPDPAVRFFSGTATYRKTFDVTSGQLSGGRQILDLGRVDVMARVRLNGRDLGLLWRAPYRLDVTDSLRSGSNTLEIEVTNLWINRMIGDETLPEDSDRNPDGTLKSWPSWLLEGKQSPAGRQTFTSWKLWKATDKLQPSGLIGPVRVRMVAVLPARGR